MQDYSRAPLIFQLRKVIRYGRLYGPSRTAMKVRGQRHMNRRFARLPAARQAGPAQNVGMIGCGNFAFTTLAYYLRKNYGAVIRGCMDVDPNRAASLFEAYGAAYHTTDADVVLNDPSIELVFIASNHASHAPYAVRALELGKSVHIEKPHVVDRSQLHALRQAMQMSPGCVNLGFNRPNSALGLAVRKELAAESGSTMLNWFVAGHEIPPDHWYFSESEGGRVLGNLCHWTDLIYQSIAPEDRYPIRIVPTRAAQSDCDISVSYVFGDGSIASITFSAKGHTFEGVRERLNAHKGDVLVGLDDFQHLRVDRGATRKKTSLRYRDHGHEANVKRSHELLGGGAGLSRDYVWETAELFLATREALESDSAVTVTGYPGD